MKKHSIYIGGEDKKPEEFTPRNYDSFFEKRLMFLLLTVISALLLLSRWFLK